MATDDQKRFEELINEIKQLFPDTTTSVRITITADNTKLVSQYRHPEQLKKSGYSMKNIQGNFIK